VTRGLPTRTLPPILISGSSTSGEAVARWFHPRGRAAVNEVTAHYHGAEAATFALHDAQLLECRAAIAGVLAAESHCHRRERLSLLFRGKLIRYVH
jgi:hypothetical protein